MIEKKNRVVSKTAAGDSGVVDDIVDFAAKKMTTRSTGNANLAARRRARLIVTAVEPTES